MSLIVQLGTTVVPKPGTSSATSSGAGGRNITYRDSRITTQQSSVATVAANSSNVVTVSQSQPQQRTIMTTAGSITTVRSGQPNSNSNLTAGALKIHPQHHRVITAPQRAQVAVVQKGLNTTTIHKPASYIELPTRKVIVPATANSRLSSDPTKELVVEKLQQQPTVEESKKLSHQTQIPLMFQYVLQEHNYVALPPASPPLSPLLHHSLGSKLNGAPSSGSPSSLSSEPQIQHHAQHHVQHHAQHHQPQNKGSGLLTLRPSPHPHHSGGHHSTHGGHHVGLHNAHHGMHVSNHNVDDGGSDISSDGGREAEPEGEETETAPEAEGEDDSVTRCICDFEHDDGYMICCDKCSVWQHVDCMGIDRMNIPDVYMCERCQPRRVDKARARNIQLRKREEFFHNDSSSDTSSSSTDSEPLGVVNSGLVKKRGGASVGARRKSEPLRKPSIGSIGYRQRRDSARDSMTSIPTPRRQPTPRKKSTENKRAPRRRKVRSESKGMEEDKSPDPWDKSPPIQSLRQWIDNYEEAVTNHYSPELRARIQSIRFNGVHSELKVPSHLLSGSAAGVAKCRLTMLPNGTKILVTTCPLGANQPIIELRGKYMLSQQHRALAARNTPPPGPFLFFHRLPLPAVREATEVCVDCRTYGNDARFVRRSCKPNSEVRHCVEKGTLHLFLVTLCTMDKNAEITIRHQEGANLPCSCGNPKDCQAQSVSPQTTPQPSVSRRNGTQEEQTRRRRGRRRTVSSNYGRDLPSPTGRNPPSPSSLQSPPALTPTTPITPTTPASASTPPHSPVPERKRRLSPSPSPLPVLKLKDEVKAEIKEEETVIEPERPEKVEKVVKVEKEESSPSPPPTPPTTRNTSARRCSTVNRQQAEPEAPPPLPSPRRSREKEKEKEREKEKEKEREKEKEKEKEKKEEEKSHRERRGKSESEQDQKNMVVKKEPVDKNKNRTLTREERKMEAIMKAFERMEKQAQKKQEAQVRQQRQKSGDKTDDQEVSTPVQRKEVTHIDRARRKKRKGRGRSNSSSQSAKEPQATTRSQRRTRLHSRGSDREPEVEPEPEADPEPEPDAEPEPEPDPDNDDISSDDDGRSPGNLNLDTSSKTPPSNSDKEGGVGGSGSGGSCSSQGSTPPTPLSSACLLVAAAVGPLAPGFKFPKTKKGLLTSWFKTPDCGSVTEPGKVTLSDMKPLSPEVVNNSVVTPVGGSGGFAKKRWLRQAISEDHCDSPNSRADVCEYVTPLKKRRLARESMSADQDRHQADSPANHESESDQPTQDEDTMDGTLPAHDTEMSSHDEGSQSAEDVDTPTVNNDLHAHAIFDEEHPMASEPPLQQLDASVEAGAEADAEETEAEDESEVSQSKRPQTPPDVMSVESALRALHRESPDPRFRTCTPPSSMPSTVVSSTTCSVLNTPPTPVPVEQPATKRKLSISEYRQRKQRASTESASTRIDTSTTATDTSPSSSRKHTSRSRSSSTSSTSSSLSSDEELSAAPIMNKIRQLDMRAAAAGAFASCVSSSASVVTGSVSGLSSIDSSGPLKDGESGEEKKGGASWSHAPTLVERQRENLTERLRREFGLFLNDEEEGARKALLSPASNIELGKEKELSPASLMKKKGTLPPPPPPGPPPNTFTGSYIPVVTGGQAIPSVVPAVPSASASPSPSPYNSFSSVGKPPLLPTPSPHSQFFPPSAPSRPNSSYYYQPFSRP